MAFDENRVALIPLLVFSQLLGLSASLMIIYNQSGSGLDWLAGQQFNYHPIFMVVGLIYLNGTGIMLYRAFPNCKKTPVKIAHMMVQFSVMALCILGLYLAVDFHNAGGVPHATSLHSWLGLLTCSVFIVQWVLSLFIFVLPCAPDSLRGAYKVLHVYFGGAVLVAATFSVVSVLGSSTLLNSLGLVILGFVGVVGIVITTDSYQRPNESYNPIK